jgi:hypothetical protein
VDRDTNGKIVMVGVIRLDGMVHVFFPDMATCEYVRAINLKKRHADQPSAYAFPN